MSKTWTIAMITVLTTSCTTVNVVDGKLCKVVGDTDQEYVLYACKLNMSNKQVETNPRGGRNK